MLGIRFQDQHPADQFQQKEDWSEEVNDGKDGIDFITNELSFLISSSLSSLEYELISTEAGLHFCGQMQKFNCIKSKIVPFYTHHVIRHPIMVEIRRQNL